MSRKSEFNQAIIIASAILDFNVSAPANVYVPGDPDCDAAILARQFLRAIERLEASTITPDQD